MGRPLGIGVIGCDHRHVYGMLQGMLDVGAVARAWWTDGEPLTLDGFRKRFPALPRVADPRAVLDDPEVDLVLIASVPCDRAQWALEAMAAPLCGRLSVPPANATCVSRYTSS